MPTRDSSLLQLIRDNDGYNVALNLGGPASLSLDELRQVNQHIQSNAFAARTKSNLNSMLKAFIQFTLIYKIPSMPASGDILCLFATWLFVSGKVHSAQSVRNYLSAVRTWHRIVIRIVQRHLVLLH